MMNPSPTPSRPYRDNDDDLAPLMGARQRRLVADTPFRDDPVEYDENAPPRVQLESFPPPLGAPPTAEKSKKKVPMRLMVWNGCTTCMTVCGCINNPMHKSEGPNGAFYRDDFNDSPWSCSMGTTEENGIWMNTSDQAGTVMAVLVWILLVYSAVTMTLLARTGGLPVSLCMIYCIFCALALASHAKTTLSDPGSVPASAVPTEAHRHQAKLNMCSQCQTYKPPYSHHCRICNRCISRMDHHCPWMNNCIGSGNMKHFVLFLSYTWLCSAYGLLLLGWNYFFCTDEECTFAPVLIHLVRVMTLLSIGAFLFTSSMIMNVCYGIMTGIGTIDRLKKKATNQMHTSDEEPIDLKDIFGIAGYYTWPFPVDPVFEDYDRVMGYSTPQRLLREQMKEGASGGDSNYPPSVISQGYSTTSYSVLNNYTPV